MTRDSFEWDETKDRLNRAKHGVTFEDAVLAFADPARLISVDGLHSVAEPRLFCVGLVGGRVMTVRFTSRNGRTRIIGAGYWRKGRRLYEREHGRLHR